MMNCPLPQVVAGNSPLVDCRRRGRRFNLPKINAGWSDIQESSAESAI